MKRQLITFTALLTLAAGFAQLQDMMSPTVFQFLEERSMSNGLLTNQGADATELLKSRFAPTRIINGIEMADVFIDYESTQLIPLLKANGVRVNCVFDDFLTAQVPVNRLDAISKIKGVINMEISGVAELCSDSTLVATQAGMVLNGPQYGLPQAYDGTGVIIGMIDVGYDYQHTAFRRSDDITKTRIVRVYDPDNSTGHPAIIDGNELSGSIFMGTQIDTLTTDSYDYSHGTHTTGIAAGRHVNGYGGMAPGADIVLCTLRNLHASFSELDMINCIKYIYAYADSVGKPCVINISMSNRFGPHDGNDRVSKAVAKCVGPGRIFVVAAGNNGNISFYSHGPALANKPMSMAIGYVYPKADESFFYYNTWLTAWVRDKNVLPVLQFHILDKQTNHIVWESELIKIYKKYSTSSEIQEYFQPQIGTMGDTGYMSGLISINPSNSKYSVTCEFKNLLSKHYTVDAYGNITSRYQIGISIYPPSAAIPNQPDSCYIDSWICTAYGRSLFYTAPIHRDMISEDGDTVTQTIENFYVSPSNRCSVGTYTVNDSIISAGGYFARDSYFSLPDNQTIVTPNCPIGNWWWQTSYQYPGYGPTGQALPTITAPCFNVISAVNHLAGVNDTVPNTVMRVGKDYWAIMTGTSMAAPAVAGIIAQWLQINPNLSPGQIKDIIAQTAIKDDYTNNPESGFRFGPNGKIDALAGARRVLGINYMIGDVNGNGLINIQDVTWLVDYLLEMPNENFVLEAADVFPDGTINIRDLTRLIDILLGL